ncbi:1,4-beta-xylanase [Rathayibacter sp. VKM Ac-2803]|uniref:glycoside hydrolase family 43 protein n=1 Tax=Rathayibacter sp. VKM Ac-2803 TaxID=2609256 RepID=UPI00135C65B6|nr:glycoside hydrolase family 43 protein [Rathayibacter sp. VKM Ac-2803]MWV48773.1 1,4-beta-xylanase [Rathayibacter sp. VKM Ac-2803]
MSGFLLAYFLPGEREDGERVRLAVSEGATPESFLPLPLGVPVPAVGERGARDPFLVRDRTTGRFVLLATDLRTWPDGDWHRAVRRGSRSILVWHSDDLVEWTAPSLHEVAPESAGNAWAPKAYWSDERGCWLVFFSAALYPPEADRASAAHQRILVVETTDFTTYRTARVALDTGRDVIDATFLAVGDQWLRFTVEAEPERGVSAVTLARGLSLEGAFETVRTGIGSPELARGEGPAVVATPERTWLLIDEFGLRGYRLFVSDDPAGGAFAPVPSARLPVDARHGSLLALEGDEAARLRSLLR